MSALQFEAIKVALKQDASGFVLTLKIHPDELPEEVLRDFVGARYALAMVRINEDETPRQYENRVKKAGILCRDVRFRKWIESVEGQSCEDEGRAVAWLHYACLIKSRTELNGNKMAQKAFDQIVEKYEREKDEPF
jgi:hypothetical protein